MAHRAFVPLVQITNSISKACLEILRASVISATGIDTRANGVLARIHALLLVFGARDVDELLANRIVEQFHEDIAGNYPARESNVSIRDSI